MEAPGSGDDHDNGDDPRRPGGQKLYYSNDDPPDVTPSHGSVETDATLDPKLQTNTTMVSRRYSRERNQVHRSVLSRQGATHLIQPQSRRALVNSRIHSRVHQIALLSGTSVVSAVAFIASILPSAAFLSLTIWVFSLLAVLYISYRYVRDELQDVVRTRGVGAFLPSRWYQMLTESSVHDVMTDDTFARENRHIMLYFFPGLTPDQRTNYIERLAPRHREQLLRPGVGYFLGDNFMRLLMGDDRYQASVPSPHHYPTTRRPPAIEVILERPRSYSNTNRLIQDNNDDDDESELGLDFSPEHLVGELTQGQVADMTRSLGLQRQRSRSETAVTGGTVCGDNDDDSIMSIPETDSIVLDEIDYEEEERVLTEAFMISMYDGIWAPFQRYWVDQLRPMTGSILRFSASLTLTSLGLGMWTSRYSSRPSVTLGSGSFTVAAPSSRAFLGTALLGGIATSATMLFRWRWLRPAAHRRRSTTPKQKGKGGRSFSSRSLHAKNP